MNERTILEHVHDLVEEEHSLRDDSPGAEAGVRLAEIEEELDQCWDRLRSDVQSGNSVTLRSLRKRARTTDTVEGYIG